MILSVVIPTHQRPAALEELLESLTLQSFDPALFEVIVVSNLPDPDTEMAVQGFKGRIRNLKYLTVGKKGSNRARNLGLANATASIAYFVDDDCVFTHPFVLEQVRKAHEDHPDALAIGGGYLTPLGASAVERAFGLICEKWLRRRTLEDQKVLNLVGGNVSYKRDALIKNGFQFNPAIEYGGAETELHIRLFLGGFKMVHLPELRLEHRARVSGAELLRKAFMQGFSSQRRWQNGLFVPSRPQAHSYFEQNLPGVSLWEKSFDHAFKLGQQYARWDGSENLKPDMRMARILIFLCALMRDRSQRKFSPLISAFRFLIKARKPVKVALPLERHFLLTHSTGSGVDLEMQRAKAYGYGSVLAPAHLGSKPEEAERIRAEIVKHGLKPVLLLDMDAPSPSESEIEKFHESGWDFHVVLGKPTPLQKQVFEKLDALKKNWTITLLAKGSKHDFRKFTQLDPKYKNKIHYVFTSTDSLWHSHPSSIKMARFLKKAARHQGTESFLLRGAAGSWPTNRRVHDHDELWPLQEIRFQQGTLTEKPLFSVVIPAYEAGSQLIQVVKHLFRQNVSGFEYEVIVVDDGSRNSSEAALMDLLARAPLRLGQKLKYIYWPRTEKSQFRAGKARNLGVTHAEGEYLCFLDSDIVVTPDYLDGLRELFTRFDVIQTKRENLTAASSRAVLSGAEIEAVKEIYPEDTYWEDFKKLEDWQATKLFWKYCCTYSFALRKDHFLAAGWFAPEFFAYGFEDVDLGYRLSLMGLRFHLNQSPVYHLYPEKNEFNYHFDLKERTRTLTLSSRVFYRLRLDPVIFNEFFPAFYQPLRGELEARSNEAYWKARGVWFRTYDWCRFMLPHLNPALHLWIVRDSSWATYFFLRNQVGFRLLKPYHFINYQLQTRIYSKIKNGSEEITHVSTENI